MMKKKKAWPKAFNERGIVEEKITITHFGPDGKLKGQEVIINRPSALNRFINFLRGK
ncbi:hypothetical protein [Nitrospina gracilis]|uniref:hypothetical protein n=1 Tax=Nitrospina gracilis TaxID=35801 RepID=UPI001F16CD3C|nr:hypothetical protein [Nitrospina gracilis]MCF8719205.1 hypothetical protein [Nitrospina gracilis Nb-211]